jgi:replicative DNA helicase
MGSAGFECRRSCSTPLYVDDTAQLSVFELRTKARRLKKEHDIHLIIIDYLQLMKRQRYEL